LEQVFTGGTFHLGLALLGFATVQSFVGIVFFRHWAALAWFLFESLLLFGTAVAIMVLPAGPGRFAGWAGAGLFALLFVLAFRTWRTPKS